MDAVNLFDLASQQSRWLSVRQTAVAGNIANANTPGYGAVEVEPFESVLNNSRVALISTNPGHLAGNVSASGFKVEQEDTGGALMPSKNTVVLENELLKSGEIRRGFELNTAIVKAFHRFALMTMKG
ncbi:MAG: flagellar basal body rod protein FlgB [Hyphomicrobiales bacterium]|jgi:flagellar basal-body rod protein FlgB|nr:flagellar basal body rod protein FlgB [Hyphomicrobiales bacterium]MCO5080173.1 flagellar basal body rod protein FlgB [Rhizobiaceae bacterium]